MPEQIILASTSQYRKQLLSKLNIPFECIGSNVDETPIKNETANQLVSRLAESKALSVANQVTDRSLIIGSDQVAVFNNEIIGKPHTHENAIKQLTQFSGKEVTFLTGLSVLCCSTNQVKTIVEPFTVQFKDLSLKEIDAYLLVEQPYDCAGSFKVEGLGICLFSSLNGDDPNTLIGLPLIKLTTILSEFGFNVLNNQNINK